MSSNKEIYKRIKIAGLVFLIPFMLAAGPVAGFFIGDYIHKRFALGYYIIFIFITLGFIAGYLQTIKIIRLAAKVEKAPK